MPGLLIQTSPCKRNHIISTKMLLPRSSVSTSPPPSPSPEPTPSSRPTIHSRRTLSYKLRRSGSQSPPPALSGLGISNIGLVVPTPAPTTVPVQEIQGLRKRESDAECWSRMLALQREYHCYNSARLEAAVEALENGWGEDAVQIPSRLCLDLLNEQLEERMRAWI
ncbi:uncharacterized protein PAC_08063 [Phialocephala subalpina]|uniref:Uncharacterized protein n=1 Tax=Phialocephala subalpina TaxID=576137 RepID=A0A1L7WZI3_9HELO|nr:uncharacterized protein PAC_08063 [Phialocephala subalpina]